MLRVNIVKGAKKHFVFRLRFVKMVSRSLVYFQRIIFSAVPLPPARPYASQRTEQLNRIQNVQIVVKRCKM